LRQTKVKYSRKFESVRDDAKPVCAIILFDARISYRLVAVK
jgi:hypothetical protein